MTVDGVLGNDGLSNDGLGKDILSKDGLGKDVLGNDRWYQTPVLLAAGMAQAGTLRWPGAAYGILALSWSGACRRAEKGNSLVRQ
jgi:hypothetical protein